MFWKMCATVALCLGFLLAFSEGFFIPASLRKQPDCVRRAPQTTPYNNQQWIPSPTSGTNGVNVIQGGYNSIKDYNSYPQQLQQQSQQQQQQNQQLVQQPQLYQQPTQNIQVTAPKYEATPFQTVNQPQYAFEGVYPAPLNSYHQNVQLVPCLCPVNKEMIEQQQVQFQQQQTSASPTTVDINKAENGGSQPQPTQKKTS